MEAVHAFVSGLVGAFFNVGHSCPYTSAVGSVMLSTWMLPVDHHLPYECALCAAGGKASNMYMWAEFEPPIDDSCSAVRAIDCTNVLVDNHANIAGGAVYATDMATLNFTCSNGLPGDDTTGCPSPSWSGNSVGPPQGEEAPLLG